MFSKRWQKKQAYIQHISLALFWGGPLFWLQLDLLIVPKLLLIAGTCVLALVGGYWLNRRFATSWIRIFEFEDDVAAGIVQRALNAAYIPFSRQPASDGVHFLIRDCGLTLVVESYPLNLPIDDHIKSVPASKIEIKGLSPSNQATAEKLCQAISTMVETVTVGVRP
ncbi:MAG: hypothetical protein AB8G95_24065 [Anaerolineae bacterium]